MKKMYELTAVPLKTVTATARYGHKVFHKGRQYTVRRKLTAEDIKWARKYPKITGFKLLKARVI
jgi:hypothetical protein